MSITTHPVLTYDELLRRATEDWAAITSMAYTKDLTAEKAHSIAAKALRAAIDDWSHETGEPDGAVSLVTRGLVLTQLISAGWDEWEREQQLDLFEDQDIWRGAAAHEARGELG